MIILGIGNPGSEYVQTRHNAGIMFVDYLSRKHGIKLNYDKYLNCSIIGLTPSVFLATSNVFMNESGICAKKIMDRYKISLEEFFLAHDDLDIKLGEYKIQMSKGPKLHNGVLSVEKFLETSEFNRIRIGVDARGESQNIPGEEYVLNNFRKNELDILEGVFNKLATDLSL